MTRVTRFVVSGRVQGVGFRAFVADAARTNGVAGWVRNLGDGSVEVHAEADPDAVSRLELRLWQGPSHARVDDVVAVDAVPESPVGFRIA